MDIDLSNIKDLYDDDGILEGMEEELINSDEEEDQEEGKEKKTKRKRLDKKLVDKL